MRGIGQSDQETQESQGSEAQSRQAKQSSRVKIDPQSLSSLDAKIPLLPAFPYGIQHVLAMFVANLAPIAIIAAAAGLSEEQSALLIQNAMFIAGIGTFIQLFPVWRVGSGLPIVMGISFTFVSVACGVAATAGYGALIGAVIVGGIIEGVLGLFARYWRKIIPLSWLQLWLRQLGFLCWVLVRRHLAADRELRILVPLKTWHWA